MLYEDLFRHYLSSHNISHDLLRFRCLCFSPPGCVFTKRTAEESKEYVWSYVLHNDIVPRLSYHSLVHLRNDVIEMIARIKVPKHEVFDHKTR